LVFFGKTLLFGGGEESFLRNWQGRPFAQLISIITYGFVPFYLVKYYAQNLKIRSKIERVFSWAIYIILFYAYLQIFSYIFFSFPITGRWITEFGRDLGAVDIFGIPFYRVNSLAGEPRDLGTFLVGSIPLYIYINYMSMNYLKKIVIALMLFVLLLTTSNSALLATGLTLLVIILDAMYQKRRLIRSKYSKYVFLSIFVVFLMFNGEVLGTIGMRTVKMYNAVSAQLETTIAQPAAATQATNLVVIYYILSLRDVSPVYSIFGYGYSNYVTPTAGLLKQHFNFTFEDTGVYTSDAYVIKLFIEDGITGLLIYLIIFFYTLGLSRKLLSYFRVQNDSRNYYKSLWLRFAFIAFFVSGAIQMSFFYFIIMGLTIGWLNELQNGELAYNEERFDINYKQVPTNAKIVN